jgi:hypothetical protein
MTDDYLARAASAALEARRALKERDRAMVRARRAGATLAEIGAAVGLTAPGVLKRLNVLAAPHSRAWDHDHAAECGCPVE